MEEYDVAIVGCGPAGLRAARKLAEKDVKVIAFDKKQEIGVPVRCAEGLGSGWFKRLNLKPNPKWCANEMYGAMLYSPSGRSLEIRTKKVAGYVLERRMFEKFLAREAALEGALIRVKSDVFDVKRKNKGVELRVRCLGEEQNYSASVVIAADGVDSLTARRLGLDTTNKLVDIDSGFQYEMAGIDFENQDLIHLYFGNNIAPRGYCLTPDTEIITKNTVKPIIEVRQEEEVLTLDGWMPVSAISERDYAGEIIKITPFMFNKSVKLTADHFVYVWNKKSGMKWKRAKELIKGVRGEHAKGDYLVFPLPSDGKTKYLKVSDFFDGIVEEGRVWPVGRNRTCKRFKYKYGIPEKIELTEDLLEFFGWFISEGNANSNGIIISNTDKKIIERLEKIGRETFGVKPNYWVSKDRKKKCIQLGFSSVILNRMFSKLFGVGCKNKRLPSFVYGLPKRKKIAILKGLFGGDGAKEISSEGYHILSYISTSKSLIYDIWMLLAKMNVIGAISKNKTKNAWRIRIRGKQLDKLSKVLGKCKHGHYERNRGFIISGNYILLGIRELKSEFYTGKVYDIESGGSFCPFFTVHNCWIFPKGKHKANVGIGIGSFEEKTAKYYLDKFIENYAGLKNGSIIHVNSGAVPVGGFLDSMVKDNLIVVGDAAHQVDPIHGGGIGIAMEAADIVTEVAAEAIKKKDFSEKQLSKYNSLWYEKRGNSLKKRLKAKHLAEDLADKDLETLVDTMTGEDILKIAEGELAAKAKIATKLVTKPALMKKMLKHLK